MTLAKEHDFPHWETWCTILRGWALTGQGQEVQGIAQIYQGLDGWRALGGMMTEPMVLAPLAEACGNIGQHTEGQHRVVEGLTVVNETEEHFFEAELYRAKGELLHKAADSEQQTGETPEACFRRAMEVARQQQAKSLELRAAMSLARL